MQVKRFFAADMRQAMKLVRDELGPDAAILGNRRVAGGIELTAALDYQAPPAPSKPNPALEVELRKTQARIAEARAELTARPAENQRKDRQLFAEEKPARPSLAESMTAAQAKPQAGGQTLEAMRFELNGLRELIEVQLGSIAWGQLQHQRPQQANLWRRLQRMGLPAELSKPLLERVAAVGDTRQAWRMLLAHLSRAVQTPEQDPLDAGVLALAPLARKRMVLIDTAGLPASDPALRMQLEALASPSLNVKNYLVMATTSQSQVLKSAYQTYRHCGLAGCILTKLDEAGSLGESMALAIAQRLPVAYLADGPRIPDDLQVARSHQLVSRAVSLQAPEEPSEDAMAEMFAGLYQQPARRAG
ncbi:flagellar biosynthesis protein FlhF [Pseudomonas aeruginosa]|uniref:flagellar biosynthesis protein FlhF n=1 Tax=Pseudomonas aeruginosa TaxID=287 RepID=UPI00106817C9|nr:flagellar biosynthesis protein FlhF [Pseudomonas aeruginosa]TEO46665.1 flagellar biosynthesis protein FlhF [Pseudomonas aeruginosa]TEO58910.1 flagellar biosynthesis protein FlhF [Pseudomonas aeruginosa]